jgi:hypothetical protein
MNQAAERVMALEPPATLSVIVTAVGGGRHLQRCLDHLRPQLRPEVEVLVPHDSTLLSIGPIQANPAYAAIRFVDMGEVATDAPRGTESAAHEMYDRRTAAGIRAASGQIIALLQDYGAPARDWVDQVLLAHELPYGVIGGSVEHAGQGAWNWAVFLLDFGRFQKPLPEGRSQYLTDINVSYKRSVLESVRPLWEYRYKEVTVNWELSRRGVELWQRPQIEVQQDRGQLRLSELLVERYCWGRLFGSIRVQENSGWVRLVFTLLSPLIPLVLITRISLKVLRGRRNVGSLVRCFPHFVVITTAWCVGEFVGYLTGRESAR